MTNIEDKIWKSIEYFFRQYRDHGIVQHQINSFHDFIELELPLIIKSRNPLIITKKDENETTIYEITVSNPRIVPPSFKSKNGTYNELFPYQARIQNMTYASALIVDFIHTVSKYNTTNNDKKKISEDRYVSNDVIIGYIPIMVQSKYCRLFGKKPADYKECAYDRGGYFIVKGQEKVIISQEKFAENRLFVGKKRNEKYSYYTEVKSVHPDTQYVYSTYIRYQIKNDEIRIKIPKAKEDINIFTLFKALGCTSDKQILDLVKAQSTEEEAQIYEELLLPTMMENINIRTRQDAINTMCKIYNYIDPEISKLEELLQKVLIPHIGKNLDDKIVYLVYSVKSLLDTMRGKRKLDDRDNMANKRIDTPGSMLGHLFRYLYHKFINDISKDITNPNAQINISKIVKSNSIEIGFRYALSTGHWHVKNENLIVKKVGVAQVLNRFNYYSTLSHLRRINSELDNNAKLTTPRQVHGSSIMTVCVAETPEGHGIGITKNLAMLATITSDNDPLAITDLIMHMGILVANTKNLNNIPYNYGKILINGKWIGSIENIISLADELRSYRRNGKINNMTSIRVDYQYNELLILTTGGRFVHPVFVVKNNIRLIDDYEFQDETSWRHLIRDGIVEYTDADEMESCMIAMDPKELKNPYVKFTHCEIHASAMLGLCGSLIPFSNHTQSPRVAYQASMCKQAVGVYATNYQDRMDSGNHILWSPQRPLVDTRYTDIIHANKIPAGQNVIVAFGCYSGSNIEDSIVINKTSVERGLFRSTFFRTYKDEEKKNMMTLTEEQFCNPTLIDGCKGIKYGSYEHMDRNGFVRENTHLNGNDVIIGKITPESVKTTRQTKNVAFKDISTTVRANEHGIVDRGIVTTNQENYRLAKVRLRQERAPTVGDKFACYDDQTQVLTNEGWKYFKDLSRKELICTLVDGKIQYILPNEYFEYDVVEQEMIRMANKHIDVLVTPNHMMYVQCRSEGWKRGYELLRADEVYDKMFRVQNNAENILPDVEFMNIGDYRYKMDDWLKLVGMYISDGSTIKGCRYNYTILACKKERKINYNLALLENLGIVGRSHIEGIAFGGQHYEHIFDELKSYGQKCNVKRLPEYVWSLSQRQCRILLDALIEGDGCRTTIDRYGSTSKKLCDDIQRLALHCGWASNLTLKSVKGSKYFITETNYGERNFDFYQITILKNHNKPFFNKKFNPSNIKEKVKYTGKVYCLEVNPSHIIYIRRGERNCGIWCGQSRSSQKGTVGALYDEADMPFTEDGIIPDIIVNSHGIPSRMTISQLLECVFGKIGALSGKFQDGTTFRDINVQEIAEELESYGFQRYGNETMYNGQTGKMMKYQMFIGPTYYQRLKHMTVDKKHARAKGPILSLTHQPAEGKSRGGGRKADVRCKSLASPRHRGQHIQIAGTTCQSF